MGVLHRKDREVLAGLLLKLPNITHQATRQALIADLPEFLRNSVALGNAPNVDIGAIIETVDSDAAQLEDGTWPILWVIEKAMNWLRGARLARQLQEIYDTARQFAQAPPISEPPTGPRADAKAEIERIVNLSAHFINVEAWLGRLREILPRVCRIEIPRDDPQGTGFLVGPGLVMTNQHVVKDVVGKPEQLSKVVLRFDYRTDARGLVVQEGKEFRLALNQPILASPEEDLDYALLSVDGSPGTETVGSGAEATPRKWLTPQAGSLVTDQPLFVIQHPEGRPLQVAFGLVTGVTATGVTPVRVNYRTNTEPGSSGSPCFSDQWELVALHRAGNIDHNEGVPFSAILERAEVKNALEL
jgi:V8-like Glu-specific endopeptidase